MRSGPRSERARRGSRPLHGSVHLLPTAPPTALPTARRDFRDRAVLCLKLPTALPTAPRQIARCVAIDRRGLHARQPVPSGNVDVPGGAYRARGPQDLQVCLFSFRGWRGRRGGEACARRERAERSVGAVAVGGEVFGRGGVAVGMAIVLHAPTKFRNDLLVTQVLATSRRTVRDGCGTGPGVATRRLRSLAGDRGVTRPRAGVPNGTVLKPRSRTAPDSTRRPMTGRTAGCPGTWS